jgi:hypothetical protein
VAPRVGVPGDAKQLSIPSNGEEGSFPAATSLAPEVTSRPEKAAPTTERQGPPKRAPTEAGFPEIPPRTVAPTLPESYSHSPCRPPLPGVSPDLPRHPGRGDPTPRPLPRLPSGRR